MIGRGSQRRTPSPRDPRGRGTDSTTPDIYSNAPYNFIPLNEKVVPAQALPNFNTYHQDRYTGYIELEIEALTPLYIRDTLNDQELLERLEHEKRSRGEEKLFPYSNPDFFSPGALTRIPGSSLRGMIRTLVEITSFGKFVNFADRRLYYRGFADRCHNLRNNYTKYVNCGKPNAGILIKQGLRYYIIPTAFRKIDKTSAASLLEKQGKEYKNFTIHKVKDNENDYYLVISGQTGEKNKKKVDYLIQIPTDYSRRIELSQIDIDDYRNDKERQAKINLLDEVRRRGEVPCFYSIYRDNQNRQRVAFGHTLCFRIPYIKSIGDHVPDKLKDCETIDLAEAIFGKETSHASRVFFEDCFLTDTQSPFLETATPKILSSPKPTCFQHYLTQNPHNLENHPRNLAHYNDPNPIRGYKLYWHRIPDWIETDEEKINKHKTQYTRITPVRERTKFKGRIRFENLSSVELGALLFVLKLPDECCHKLGMGKPLGLGSVKITPTLYLSDRVRRYTDLFSEWTDTLGTATDKQVKDFINAFESYVLESLGETTKDLWEHKRLKKLKLILTYNKSVLENSSKTSYITDPKEYRPRRVLPEPENAF